MWTNAILSRYGVIRCSSSSSTGPQYCDWHSAGVANIATTGFPVPITSDSDTSCSGHAGERVQIGLTPIALALVGDASRGACAPMTGAAAVGFTCTANGTFLPCTMAAALYTPATGKAVSTTAHPRPSRSPA